MWLGMLLAMIGSWGAENAPVYSFMDHGQTIAYVSDIGAKGLKPLFITGGAITGVFLTLSFLCERWLRHAGQLAPNKGFFDKACAIVSIFFGIAGALGLILLAVFDTHRHPNKHRGFIIMFLIGYLVSAILICFEYLRLGLFYRSRHRVIIYSFALKVAFVIIEVALAISWVVLEGRNTGPKKNTSAVLEWIVAFIFTFYILSFAVDLFPSVRTRRRVPQGEKMVQVEENIPAAATYEHDLPTDNMDETASAANAYRGQHMA
ncbi:hypothetical protein MPDQ_001634 [Monascus purpureus]|uniref:CWH43-like N-terminal domain-containing protein n=1 Tax=Monascus purpureus TaxID=5098 RepID=A0A507QM70_MONPU|nr:hypothetical protein MPDQ_001634 [Monascus purpureus]